MIFPSSVYYTKVRHQNNFLVSPFLDIVLKFPSFLSSTHWSIWIIFINVDGGYRIYFSIFELIPLICLWLEDFSWRLWVHSYYSNKILQKHIWNWKQYISFLHTFWCNKSVCIWCKQHPCLQCYNHAFIQRYKHPCNRCHAHRYL